MPTRDDSLATEGLASLAARPRHPYWRRRDGADPCASGRSGRSGTVRARMGTGARAAPFVREQHRATPSAASKSWLLAWKAVASDRSAASPLHQAEQAPAAVGSALSQLDPSGSEAGDEGGGSSLGIAEEPVLARVAPIQRPASILPAAVRPAESEVSVSVTFAASLRDQRAAAPRGTGRHARAPVVVQLESDARTGAGACTARATARCACWQARVGPPATSSASAARDG